MSAGPGGPLAALIAGLSGANPELPLGVGLLSALALAGAGALVFGPLRDARGRAQSALASQPALGEDA